MAVLIQEEDFDLSDELKLLKAGKGDAGAIISFVGTVRGDESLRALELEHYPNMTLSSLEEIQDKAISRWKLIDVRIIHRFGYLSLGEQIMMVAVASHHRREAFEAADYILDFLQSRAPFWKREITKTGESWVASKAEDEDALTRW